LLLAVGLLFASSVDGLFVDVAVVSPVAASLLFGDDANNKPTANNNSSVDASTDNSATGNGTIDKPEVESTNNGTTDKPAMLLLCSQLLEPLLLILLVRSRLLQLYYCYLLCFDKPATETDNVTPAESTTNNNSTTATNENAPTGSTATAPSFIFRFWLYNHAIS
jgi:epidermal growth factor receptor substrate 15